MIAIKLLVYGSFFFLTTLFQIIKTTPVISIKVINVLVI